MRTAGALFGAWLLLAAVAFAAVRGLELDYRIDAFLPVPDSARQALVVDQVGSGPGGRTILAAVKGAEPERLAQVSDELAERWRALGGIDRVDNGRFELDAETEAMLMRYRFALLPEPERWFSEAGLDRQLTDRLAEITTGGSRVERLVRRDPLGMLPALAERLVPGTATRQIDGVWFDPEGERALLSILSAHPPFETQKQAELLDQLRLAFEGLEFEGLRLELGGAPVIAVDSATRSRAAAGRLGALGGALVVLILLWVWRSPVLVIAGAVPLAAGLVAGLVATSLMFDSVHGLTLAFGVTLLGVALDYPVHLFSHATGEDWRRTRRAIRAPLLLGMISTVVAYLAIWQSTSPGLAQLGAFCMAGLPAAAGATLLLPHFGLGRVAPPRRRPLELPRLPWLVVVLALAGAGVLLLQGQGRWSDSLDRLSPVDPELLAADISLRNALGAGEVRHLVVTSAESLDEVLAATEAATGALAEARERGLIESWQAVDTLLPSASTFAQRRRAWPSPEEMAERFAAAESRFRPGAFEPFLEDLEALSDLPAPTPAAWSATPLAARIDGFGGYMDRVDA
ncbi:MAG: MMPL family transporter, partial [Wenzhouxiangella sp.]